MRRIFRGEAFTTETIALYADACLGENPDGLASVTTDDVRVTGEATPVTLASVTATSNVNALPNGAELTFSAMGLTIVYGDNGSGKSGFARVLKQAVRARAPETVHTDIFENPAGPPSAQVGYLVGGAIHTADWTEEAPSAAELSRVSFFDGDCGAVYLSRETDAAFRPFGLDAFDALVRVCDDVKADLDRRSVAATRRATGLPTLQPGTKAASFAASINRTSSNAAIGQACQFSEDDETRLTELRVVISTTSAGSPSSRAQQLARLAERLERVSEQLDALAERVAVSTVTELRALAADRRDTAVAAEAARSLAVDASNLPGIGESAWRSLWEAARAYSEEVAFLERDFPVTDSAVCVLCQQPLDAAAQDRLVRFESFVKDRTQQAADAASAAYDAALARLAPLGADAATVDTIRDLESEDAETAALVLSYLNDCDAWLERLREVASAMAWDDAPEPPEPAGATARSAVARLRAVGQTLVEASDQEGSVRLRQESAELEDRRLLHLSRAAVVAERDRLVRVAALAAAKSAAATNAITQKSVDLTNAAITDVLVDRFSRETDRLGLERVVLRSVGGRRGVLRYRTRFVDAVQEVPLPEVLSEGEQTALGLAGFLAEVWTEASKSAVVFDDPVSSLDHERRDKVAERIVGLASERQVIVFSHDVAFVRSLKKHADAKGVPVTSRSVERVGSKPGHCSDHHKFSLKLMGERLKELQARLADLEKDAPGLTPEQYRERAVQWYGLMRRAWERAIEDTLLGRILTRDSLEVHPTMVRVLTAFTVEDNKELQHGYGRATEFAEMHDESDVENRPAPSLDDLREDLERINGWNKRVDSRRNMSAEELAAATKAQP